MADMQGGPPSPWWLDLIRPYLQPRLLIPGLLGALVGAIWLLPKKSLLERGCYLVSGSLIVIALGPVLDPVIVAWAERYGIPAVGLAHVGIFLTGTAGAKILTAAVAAIIARIRQLGGVPQDPPAPG